MSTREKKTAYSINESTKKKLDYIKASITVSNGGENVPSNDDLIIVLINAYEREKKQK